MCSSDIFLSVAFSFLTISMTDPHSHNWKIDDSLCYLNHGDVLKDAAVTLALKYYALIEFH